ncbi:Hsp70 family protein [Promicromonospora citrea]|uniref:Hsp70 family protein n=1 Tax=Promicromonospora citrea TaxID=43677 RepID=UPI0036158026
MRENVDFGIDLGTTNSAVAVMDGDRAGVLRDPANAEFTPSVVHVSRSGNVLVGSSVVAKAVTDPANTAAEFKLRMGRRDDTVLFEASGTTMSPEELSAQVLMSLRGNVSVALGEQLQAAVITVPAAFTMDQHAATMRAAELAGIRSATLLQEPTAAAWAYLSEQRTLPDKAFWLVYDFGGGTFDAAVVKIEQGEFSVVTHAGDNALGGKRIDWALVDEVLKPALHAADPSRPVVSRDNPRTVGALARLKSLAESIKIQLAARTEVLVEDDIEVDGVDVPFSCTVTRDQLDAVARELVAASVRHCRKALADARLGPSDVSRVLLVGGTSKMVLVRELLGELGIPLDHSQDPITVVARGAAYYAATVRRPRTDDHTPAGTVRLRLDVPAAGQDDDPSRAAAPSWRR